MVPRTIRGLYLAAAAGAVCAFALGVLASRAATGSAAVHTCFGKRPTIVSGAAKIVGRRASDTILVLGGGAHVVLGMRGSDRICGGPGKDTIGGGRGRDRIAGGGGNDQIAGDRGTDRLDGGAGDDSILSAKGGDTVEGGPGEDSVHSGQGSDTIAGGPGDDRLLGEKGNGKGGGDYIDASDGVRDKRIDCGAGRDELVRDRNDPRGIGC